MLNDKQRAEMDQMRTSIIESFPPLIYGMFKKFKDEGFTEEQAFELAKSYFIATIHAGVNQ